MSFRGGISSSGWSRMAVATLALSVLGCLCGCSSKAATDVSASKPYGVPGNKACLYVNGHRELKGTLVVDGKALDAQPVQPGFVRRFHLEPGDHAIALKVSDGTVAGQASVNLAAGRSYVFNPSGADRFMAVTYRYKTGTAPKPELVIVIGGPASGGRLQQASGPYSWLMPEKGAAWRYTYAERESEKAVDDAFFEIKGECGPADTLPEELYSSPEKNPSIVRYLKTLPEKPSLMQWASAVLGREYEDRDTQRAKKELAAQPAAGVVQAAAAMLREGDGSAAAQTVYARLQEMDAGSLLSALRTLVSRDLVAEALEQHQSRARLEGQHYFDAAKTPEDRQRIEALNETTVKNVEAWWRGERDKVFRAALSAAQPRLDANGLAKLCLELEGSDRPMFVEVTRGLMFPDRLQLVRAIRQGDRDPIGEWMYPLLIGPGGFGGGAFQDPVLGPELLAIKGVDQKGHPLFMDYANFLSGDCPTNRPADHRDRLAAVIPLVPYPGSAAGRLIAEYGEKGLQAYEKALGHRPNNEERRGFNFPHGRPLPGMADWYGWLLEAGEESERMTAFKAIYECGFADDPGMTAKLKKATEAETHEPNRVYMQRVLSGEVKPRLKWPK